ncbi:hypothetical protein HZ993_12775 [Rhodoferax sp. AJA081-3]|uniref:hypothetical protein n=1 Tax=Rhodoferax sp. AJA081-3 TaxID=2752316 RepID=UPI001ADF0C91|nr:hypothetical protein [Rhodoferax sp. AJA081-3]QTN26219.1 hypothetical protein HZ993_12775 [Rhodoferax sp. AJA081-3]
MSPASATMDEVAEGAAFPMAVKILASLFMAALLYWGTRAAHQIIGTGWSIHAALFMAVTFSVIAFCYYWILQSRTMIDENCIHQSWMWSKRVALADISQIKFVYVPYLQWLIAPRLIVRARGRGLFVFHAADNRVLQKFAHLSLGGAFFTGTTTTGLDTADARKSAKD